MSEEKANCIYVWNEGSKKAKMQKQDNKQDHKKQASKKLLSVHCKKVHKQIARVCATKNLSNHERNVQVCLQVSNK